MNEWIFVGIGSILSWPGKYPRAVVFGSGFGYRKVPQGFSDHIKKNWKIYCLRGPLSARKAGLDSASAITDPSILVHKYLTPDSAKTDFQKKISVIPHWITALHEAERLSTTCRELGYQLVDPRLSADDVLQKIAGSKRVLTESLHGAIIADTLRIPWTILHFPGNHHTSVFKWMDWCKSMEVSYEPSILGSRWTPSMLGRRYAPHLMDRFSFAFQKRRILPRDIAPQLKNIVEKIPGSISREVVFNARIDAMQVKLNEFIKDYRSGMFDD